MLKKNGGATTLKEMPYESAESLSAILNCIDGADIYVSDLGTYEIVFINKSLLDKYGNITGKRCFESIYTGQNVPCSFCTNKLFLSENAKIGKKKTWTFKNEVNNKWYERQDIFTIWENQRTVKVSILNEIKNTIEFETSIAYELKIERLLYNITKRFINVCTDKIDECITLSIREIGEYLKASNGYVYLLFDNDTKIEQTHAWCTNNIKPISSFTKELPINDFYWLLQLLCKGEVFSTYDVSTMSNVKPYLVKFGKKPPFNSILYGDTVLAPIDYENRLIGFTGYSLIGNKQLTPFMVKSTVRRMGEIFAHVLVKKIISRQIEHLAHYDQLTNLPNRTLFSDRLSNAINHSKRNGWTTALLFLDLDGFKKVNDMYGHDFGDIVLRQAAERIKNCLRESDTVGRLGGDEFTIIIANLAKRQDMASICQKIIENVSMPYNINGTSCCIGASIGVSIYPDNGQTNENLLKCADIAMYQAKMLGKNNYQFYNPTNKVDTFKEINNKRRLQRALDTDEFIVHYQPQFDIKTGRIKGVEALIRWYHPELGVVFPSNFLKEAIEAGLMFNIDEWIIRHVCCQIRQWQADGLPHISVNVNISYQNTNERKIINAIERALMDASITAEHLNIEFTESSIILKDKATVIMLNRLKETGIKLSVDGFSADYTSLHKFKNLPIDTIKVSPQFIQKSTINTSEATLARALFAMAHNYGLQVIAVGVETEEQFEFIRQLKCDMVQGYLFSNPMTADKFRQFMATRYTI
ncbi:MAG: EAL domain-containing protein [Candidatus Magnetoovum sp. WYHC-5]|nr:EAL domain-containing protein [Candidatus Magnetoovum sp. WYHC-5]